jgi:hypothetical protein
MCESEMRAEHGGSVVGSAGGMQAGEDIHGSYTTILVLLTVRLT